MDKDKKSLIARTPDVLRKLNPESLLLIERGLLGDIPKKLQPNFVPVRGHSTDLQVAKPSGFLSSCLPVIPDSPGSDKFSSDDETTSPLKKSFSFRDKLSRISFLRKDKQKHEKPKCKTIVEDDKALDSTDSLKLGRSDTKSEHDYKSDKRFWFFRQKEAAVKRQKQLTPIYQRSKSFEFLPRAIAEENELKPQSPLSRQNSYAFGSTDTVGDAWTSSESLQYISDIGHNNDDAVFLKSVPTKQTGESSNNDSSMSTVTSGSSGIATNILKSESVQDLLDEFSKAVELFSENYLSDCEPYTRTRKDVPLKEKRKSASFSTLPSPKVVQVTAVKPSDEFRTELSRLLNVKVQKRLPKSPRRGSVTDWFVLEEEMGDSLPSERVSLATMDANKFRRAQKKPMNRVRRVSSTKYSIYLENDLQDENLNKWSDYTPKTLRTKPSLQLIDNDKENPFRRYRKRNHTGQLTNKAWTELANEKKEICKMKKEHLEALIAESESRKRYYDLQNQLLELEVAKKKKEYSLMEN